MCVTTVQMGMVDVGFDESQLVSLGLGSCVGVAIYQPGIRIAALGHVMLPVSQDNRIASAKSVLMAIPDGSTQIILRNALKDFTLLANEVSRERLLARYAELRPSAILLDHQMMPSGQDVLREIMAAYSTATVVMHCRGFQKDLFREFMSLGAKDALFMPYSEQGVGVMMSANIESHMMKFADVMIPYMIEKLAMFGLSRDRMVAKIAGGAQMFPGMDMDLLKIGTRNAEKIKELLSAGRIRIISEDIGGYAGRSISFDVATGIMQIRTKDGRKEI